MLITKITLVHRPSRERCRGKVSIYLLFVRIRQDVLINIEGDAERKRNQNIGDRDKQKIDKDSI